MLQRDKQCSVARGRGRGEGCWRCPGASLEGPRWPPKGFGDVLGGNGKPVTEDLWFKVFILVTAGGWCNHPDTETITQVTGRGNTSRKEGKEAEQR